MKIIKKIIALLCALCMTASLAACNNAEEERHNALMQEIATLSQQVTSLNQQITSLNEQIDTLTGEMDSLKEQESAEKEALTEQLEAQNKEIEFIQKKLENLMGMPIELTAEKPIYGRRKTEEVIASFDVSNPPEGIFDYDAFGAFKTYVQNDLGKLTPDIFYFLDPGDKEVGWHARHKQYDVAAESITEDGTLIAPMIDQYMMIYDEVVDGANDLADSNLETGFSWSICLHVYFAPLPQDFWDNRARIKLEFGDYEESDAFSNKYFNIYISGTCIGTCYYDTKGYVSETWFKNYLYKNLLRSDTLN